MGRPLSRGLLGRPLHACVDDEVCEVDAPPPRELVLCLFFEPRPALVCYTGCVPTRGVSESGMSRGLIPKSELRKVKQRVAKLRKQGHEIWTDDEVTAEGWVTEESLKPPAGGLHVGKEQQKESWDCGLACVQMVIGVLGDAKPSSQLLMSRIAAPSVWTIDLAYLLSDFGVACQYLTATPELDEEAYRGSAFYASALAQDARRVDVLLRAAATEGIEVSKRTLSEAELWNLMRDEETLVIALVDARLLHRRHHPSHASPANSPREGPTTRGQNGHAPTNGDATDDASAFMGHYVLLLGLDDARHGFVINDPAREDERTFVRADAFEAARHANGTDEDLILINAYQSPPVAPAVDSKPKIVRVCEQSGQSMAAPVAPAGGTQRRGSRT